MKFSESEIQPLWDEVARIIGDGVIQMRHRGEPLSADALIGYLDEQLVTAVSCSVQRLICSKLIVAPDIKTNKSPATFRVTSRLSIISLPLFRLRRSPLSK